MYRYRCFFFLSGFGGAGDRRQPLKRLSISSLISRIPRRGWLEVACGRPTDLLVEI
jgi:hypothetical protein